MTEKYGADAQTALEFYPATNDSIAGVSQVSMANDMIFGTQNYIWANKTSDKGSKVWVYRFAHKVPGTGQYAKFGAFHTGEVPYAYNNLKFVNRPWQDGDYKLAETMSSYWANFASTGNPNDKGLTPWPAYNSKSNEIMILNIDCMAEKMPNAKALEFLISKMGK